MIAVIQRVKRASVSVDDKVCGSCQKGLMALLGIAEGDTEEDVRLMCEKILKLRIFSDPDGKMNLSVQNVGGEMLVVSNFTLLAAYRNGNRPDFMNAMKPEQAYPLYKRFIEMSKETLPHVAEGIFGADMELTIVNDGPVTIVMDSKILRGPKL